MLGFRILSLTEISKAVYDDGVGILVFCFVFGRCFAYCWSWLNPFCNQSTRDSCESHIHSWMSCLIERILLEVSFLVRILLGGLLECLLEYLFVLGRYLFFHCTFCFYHHSQGWCQRVCVRESVSLEWSLNFCKYYKGISDIMVSSIICFFVRAMESSLMCVRRALMFWILEIHFFTVSDLPSEFFSSKPFDLGLLFLQLLL